MRASSASVGMYRASDFGLIAFLCIFLFVVMLCLSFCVVFLVGRAVDSMAGKQQRLKPADGLSIKVSTAETLQALKKWPTSPAVKH